MKYSKKTMMAILEFIVVCLAIVFVFKGIIMPVKVDGSSMYPTLHDGDLAFMSRLDLNSKQIKKEETKLLDWFNENHSEISREINTTKKLDDNLKTRIITLAKQYRGQE